MKTIKLLGTIIIISSLILLMAGCGDKASTGKDTSTVKELSTQKGTENNDNSSEVIDIKDITISFPAIPQLADSKDSGVLVEFSKALASEYKEGSIAWDVYPITRAMENLIEGSADVYMPQLLDPNMTSAEKAELPYMYSTDKLYDTIFVLYVNANNNEISATNFDKFNVETIPNHSKYFNNIQESDYVSGMQKVSNGRIDGYIAPEGSGDGTVKSQNLDNIKKIEFRTFPAHMLFPTGERGEQLNKLLSELMGKTKESGEFQKAFGDRVNAQFSKTIR